MEEKIIVKLEADIADLKTQLNAAQGELKRFGVGVQTDINDITLDRLNLQLKQLQTQLGATSIGSTAFKNIGAEIALVENQINGALTSINANANRSRTGFNGLNNSINQISRELPAFGLSANIGFLAISNNLPILFDEIKKVRDINKDLAASGKDTTSVFKQLSGALFSWQTALSLGVTLLTVYGGKIIELISNLVKGKEEITSAKLELDALNETYADKSLQGAIADVILLQSSLESAGRTIQGQKQFVDQYNKTIGTVTGSVKTFREAEQGIVDGTGAYINAMIARATATKLAGKAADITTKMEDLRVEHAKQNAIDQIDGEEKFAAEYKLLQLDRDRNTRSALISEADYIKGRMASKKAETHKAQQEELAAYQKQLNDLGNLTKKYYDKSGLIITTPEQPTATDRGIPQMDQMADVSDQMAEAKKLFDFYKQQGPESFNILGEAYVTNPFFKSLVDDELSGKTLKLREDIDKLGQSPTWTDPEMVQYIANLENITNLLSNTLTSAFDAALINGQNFFKVFIKGLLNMVNKLLVAVAAAALLSIILSSLGGPSSVVGFVPILKKLTGFNLEGLNPTVTPVERVAGVSGTSQGNVSFEIQGDKLYGVLQNYNGRLSKLV
jgi:hypothetical protein